MEELARTEQKSLILTGKTDLFNRWTEYIDASDKTVESYSRAIRQFNKYCVDHQIQNPTKEDVKSYREYLKEEHKPATVQAYIQAVKCFFKWTEEMGIYPNVADRVKGVKLDKGHKKDALTVHQLQRVLSQPNRDTLRGKRDYAILTLMNTTGLRTIEIVRANIEDLRTKGDCTVLYIEGKGHQDKNEYVKIAEQVEDAIRDYLTARGMASGTAPLFSSVANRDNGERMTTRSISRICKDSLKGAGLNSDRLSAHAMRHTCATLNLLNGGSLEETQQLLRHTNINTTMIYIEEMKRINNKSEERIAKAIFG